MTYLSINKFNFKVLIFILFLASSKAVFSLESDAELKSKQEITSLLEKWPQDFNARNIDAVCGLFASDLVASYPGTTDRSYEEMCRNLTASLTSTDKIFRYESPQIEQVIINGDLAVVRLIWTLNISYENQSKTDVIREKGLDVFKRQKDGNWKIAISYAYPE